MVQQDGEGVKTSAIERVIALRQANPNWTLASIGRSAGVSRERVRQILIQVGLWDGRRDSRIEKPCAWCGKAFYSYPKRRSRYCSRVCFKMARTKIVETACTWCGRPLKLKEWEAKHRRLHFCDRKCQGQWLGKNYGYGMGTGKLQCVAQEKIG